VLSLLGRRMAELQRRTIKVQLLNDGTSKKEDLCIMLFSCLILAEKRKSHLELRPDLVASLDRIQGMNRILQSNAESLKGEIALRADSTYDLGPP
jgi:hypothetical protein